MEKLPEAIRGRDGVGRAVDRVELVVGRDDSLMGRGVSGIQDGIDDASVECDCVKECWSFKQRRFRSLSTSTLRRRFRV